LQIFYNKTVKLEKMKELRKAKKILLQQADTCWRNTLQKMPNLTSL